MCKIVADGGSIGEVDEFGRIFLTLSTAYRREILRMLAEQSDQLTVEALADQIDSDFQSGDRTRQETSLHHVHLPNLERAELIIYSRDSGTVEITSLGETAYEVVKDARMKFEQDGFFT